MFQRKNGRISAHLSQTKPVNSRYLPALQCVIVQTDVLECAVFHMKAIGNRSNLHIAKPLIQVPGVDIVLNYGIELQNAETEFLCLSQTVADQFFANMQTPAGRVHCITGVGNMTAPPSIVVVQNVKPHNGTVFYDNAAVALGSQERLAAFLGKIVYLRKSKATPSSTPDTHHCRYVFFCILSNFHL